jgi:hypothetical protein
MTTANAEETIREFDQEHGTTLTLRLLTEVGLTFEQIAGVLTTIETTCPACLDTDLRGRSVLLHEG